MTTEPEPEEDDDPGCDVTAPLASGHPEGPSLDSILPLPKPDDEEAWTSVGRSEA